MSKRNEQVSEVIRQVAAEFLERESNRSSLVTVTRVEVTDKRDRAMIFITVLPDSEEEPALEFTKRKRGVFRKYLAKRKLFPLPFVDFMIDRGEKNRQRIDELERADQERLAEARKKREAE